MTHDTAAHTHVLYNAQCPVCNREIEHYAKIAETDNLPVGFTDLNDPEALSRWGLSKEDAARRLHVQKNGQLYDGIPAFVALWREIPRYSWLARLVSLPVVNRLAVWLYDLVLAPLLYRWHLRRVRKSCAL